MWIFLKPRKGKGQAYQMERICTEYQTDVIFYEAGNKRKVLFEQGTRKLDFRISKQWKRKKETRLQNN